MKKLTNKKGFTLMEMIIVVAIIAILAVITIPTLTAKTDSAEKAADAANLRSAKAVYQVMAMEGRTPAKGDIYDVATGEFVDKDTAAKADQLGQCSKHKPTTQGSSPCYIVVGENGSVEWSDGSTDCEVVAGGN